MRVYFIRYIEEPTYNDNLFDFKIDRKTKADCMKKDLKLNYYNYIGAWCILCIYWYSKFISL